MTSSTDLTLSICEILWGRIYKLMLIWQVRICWRWCSGCQLSISVKKCAVMHIHSGNARPVTGPYFDIGGYALPIVDHVKDLGALFDDCLKFHLGLHIYHIVSSASTRANRFWSFVWNKLNTINASLCVCAACVQASILVNATRPANKEEDGSGDVDNDVMLQPTRQFYSSYFRVHKVRFWEVSHGKDRCLSDCYGPGNGNTKSMMVPPCACADAHFDDVIYCLTRLCIL